MKARIKSETENHIIHPLFCTFTDTDLFSVLKGATQGQI